MSSRRKATRVRPLLYRQKHVDKQLLSLRRTQWIVDNVALLIPTALSTGQFKTSAYWITYVFCSLLQLTVAAAACLS